MPWQPLRGYAMKTELIRHRLLQADRHVTEGARLVNRQRELYRILHNGGHDTETAKAHLIMLETSQALHIAGRERLRTMSLEAENIGPAHDLRASDSRFEHAAAAAAADLALWSWDARTNWAWVSAGTRSLFGVSGGEKFDTEGVVSMIDRADFPRVESAWRLAIASGAEAEIQFRVHLPDGNMRWLLARGRSQTDPMGRLVSVQGGLRDVTEQHNAREENEVLRRELAHAGRVSVLGTLSSSLTHELGQPLAAIMLNAETGRLLLEKPNPDLGEVGQILVDIARDDRRAADVIDGMRKFLKSREIEFTQVPVTAMIHEVMTLMRSDAIVRNVVLDCVSQPGLPSIRGDRVHLSQVLINLLINAMDAVTNAPPGDRRVSLHVNTDSNGDIEIAVRDSGPGISPDMIERIFEPFFTTKTSGMGIGLSVSRTIVDAHGGKLWAENAPAGGAVFHVRLPTFA
jgi:two-component system, LuxR family, sensor kinase FixL